MKGSLTFNTSTICDEIGLPAFTGVKVPNGYTICTFCAKDGKVGKDMLTPCMTATTVVMKPRKVLSPIVTNDGDSITSYHGDKKVHIADEVTSCPEHCGRIDFKNVIMTKFDKMRG